jgi:hypothetical protein
MKKYLDKHGIKDGLLIEFVIKEKWDVAITSAFEAIGKREKEIVAIKELVRMIETIKNRA